MVSRWFSVLNHPVVIAVAVSLPVSALAKDSYSYSSPIYGLDAISTTDFSYVGSSYLLTGTAALNSGAPSSLILQNAIGFGPANTFNVQASSIVQTNMSGPIQIFTYGQPTSQSSSNPANFAASGFTSSFNGLDLGMNIGATGGWSTGGEPLPLMSNGYAGFSKPWGDGSLSASPFIMVMSSIGTAGYYMDGQKDYNYQGGNGGTVSTQIFAAQLGVSSSESAPSGSGYIWEPAGGAIFVSSVGGNGGASTEKGSSMNGGNGGAVTVDIAGSTINLNGLNGSALSPYSGIVAASVGGQAGACCVYNQNSDGSINTNESVLPRLNMTGSYYDALVYYPDANGRLSDNQGSMVANGYGDNGSASTVTVSLDNTTVNGTGSYLHGVVGASVGGATEFSTDLPGSGNWAVATGYGIVGSQSYFAYGQTGNDARSMTYPGASGNVDVSMTTNSQVNLAGSDLVGVLATSTTAPYFILTNVITFDGNTPQMGDVSVSVDATSSITLLDQARSGLSIGVLAASAGSFSVNPFMQQGSGSEWTHGVGQAGSVAVTNSGAISATGKDAIGIVALSVSNAGGVSQASGSSSNGSTFHSGQSNDVTVTHTGTLSADGEMAVGIFAGSSASGGMVLNVPTVAEGTAPTFVNGSAITPSVRWIVNAGSAGISAVGQATTYDLASQATVNGGDVTVTLGSGSSVVVGQSADQTQVAFGLVAQSIGSGGGISTGESAGLIGDAANGMSGGSGGTVTVSNSGALTTKGVSAVGILAQSIGGGGGAGASKTGLFSAIGGQGGAGGAGGALNLGFYAGSSVATEGSFAAGVIGHSIGGGGGYGGSSFAFGVLSSGALGGAGGGGGNAGDVTITSTGGSITTLGSHSQALVLQSIGGGGGVGGSANSYSVGVALDFAIAAGGSGGTGGDGGSIQSISTTGVGAPVVLNGVTQSTDSAAILLQSIGGGGGYAGSAMAHATALGVPGNNEIPSVSVSTALGGAGGSGGDGGDINFWQQGELVTRGNNSHGVLAQSVGGGGGVGGDGTAHASTALFSAVRFSMALGVGGSGGDGGDGGSATLTVGAASAGQSSAPTSILTTGHNSVGAMAQSVGGGGGAAGVGSGLSLGIDLDIFAVYGEAYKSLNKLIMKTVYKIQKPSMDLEFETGSNNGADGVGGATQVTMNGDVFTVGASSHAVMAQSIGGGGGRTMSTGGAFDVDQLNMVVNVGGAGGVGANGGAATATNSGTIVTGLLYDMDNVASTDVSSFTSPAVLGSGSYGVFAQSIGGGGGEGGQIDPNGFAESVFIYDLITGNLTSPQVQQRLDLTSQDISDISSGKLELQFEKPFSTSTAMTYYASVNVGGTGGAPGAAQNTVWGGDAAAVTVGNTGRITTYGHNSIGVFGQSIGGGGGVASSAIGPLFESSNVQTGTDITTNIAMSVGGNQQSAFQTGYGQNAGNGGDVTFTSTSATAAITTAGYAAHGVLLQSVGGGGGLAIEASTLGFQNPYGEWRIAATDSYGQQLQYFPTDGGAPETYIQTLSGTNYDPTQMTAGTVTIGSGFMRDAVLDNGTYYFSGASRSGGTGGQISMGTSASPMLGSVTTHGDSANAIFGQTIGGGGGIATIGCTNSAPVSSGHGASPCWGNTDVSGGSGQPAAYTSGYGSAGAQVLVNPNVEDVPFVSTSDTTSAGNTTANGTGDVNLYTSQAITTYGARSMGIITQSIASWGGYLNTDEALIQSVLPPVYGFVDYATGSTTIELNQSQVQTYGAGSWGLFAQSVVGGGGFAGDSSQDIAYLIPTRTKAAANSWSNNPTTVSLSSSSIQTSGTNAHGIVLQNLGSGGGVFLQDGVMQMGNAALGITASANDSGYILPNAGAVSLTLQASQVQVTGTDSRGVVLQSQGVSADASGYTGGGISGATFGGQISVTLNNDSVISAEQATALVIIGGSADSSAPNTVTVNSGQIISGMFLATMKKATSNADTPLNSWAIYAPVGYTNVTIGAAGEILGNIYLGGMSDTQGDVFNYGKWEGSSAVVADNSFNNYGVIQPAGQYNIGDSTITGSLKHYAGATIHFDVDVAGAPSQSVDLGATRHDFLSVTDLAQIDGELVPETTRLLPVSGLQFISAGTLTVSGNVRDSHVFDWEHVVNGNALEVSVVGADFSPTGYSLTDNEGALADYLQKLWDGSSVNHAALFGYLHEYEQGDHSAYQATLNQITGQVLNSQAIEMKTAFATSLSDSLSCPIVTDEGLKLNQTDCAWARVTGSIGEQSANSSNSGYHVTAGGIRLGAQKALRDQWTTGFSLGYANNYLTSTGFTSNGSFFDASLSAQKKVNDWSLGASLGMAYGWFDNNRSLNLGANGAAAAMSDSFTSSSDMMMVGLRLRAAYEYEQKDYFIKPYVDLDLMYSHTGGYTESGSGALALKANASNQFNVAISPMVEFGTDVVTDGKRRIKAYVSGGATFMPSNNVTTPMAFANGLASAGTYDVITDGPEILGRLNLGIQAFEANDLEVRAQYGLQVGDGYLSQSLSASVTWRF